MLEQPDTIRRKILVVEDDFLEELRIALDNQTSVAIRAMNIRDQTIAVLTGSDIEAAIVDSHIDREKSLEIADALTSLGIPFVFAGTNSESIIPGYMNALGMDQSSAELTLIAHQLFGAPTFH